MYFLSSLVTQLLPLFLVTVDQIDYVSQRFAGILTCCRHRGAVEGCMNALKSLCTVLLQHENTKIAVIPAKVTLLSGSFSLSQDKRFHFSRFI